MDVNSLHGVNAEVPIDSTLLGSVREVRAPQPENALFPILTIFGPNVTEDTPEQPTNAFADIDVTESGIVSTAGRTPKYPVRTLSEIMRP
jgi:hypothetical protein